MRHAILRPLLLGVLLAALAACGAPTTPDKPTIERPTPAPISVAATFEAALAQTVTVPTSGASVTVNGSDGTVYTLTFPADALLEATEVTMTPLATLTGAPLQGRVHGVLLEPTGLRLYRSATLTVAPGDGGTIGAIGFAARADGSEFHLAPPLLGGEANDVSLDLLRFSQHGAFTGSSSQPVALVQPANSFAPTDWEAQLQHMQAEMLSAERDAGLGEQAGDPDLEANLAAVLNTYYVDEVLPLLPGIEGSCAAAEMGIPQVLAWIRAASLAGLEATFAGEIERASAAVRAGAHRCWEEAITPCVDPAAPTYNRVLATARLNLLLGGSSAVYEPARPDIQCQGTCSWVWDTEALEVTASFAWRTTHTDEDGDTGTVDRSWQAASTIVRSGRYDQTVHFAAYTNQGDSVNADFSVEDVLVNQYGDVTTTEGSGTPDSVSISIQFDLSDCTYVANVVPEAYVVTTDPEHSNEHNLLIGSIRLPDQPASQAGMSGSLQLSPQRLTAPGEPSFTYGGDPASGAVSDAPGTANISWSMTPASAP